jgi:hypothetical protein
MRRGMRVNRSSVQRLFQVDYLILLPIMALAFYLAFIPHQGYPYLVHLDEWIHLAWSNQIVTQGTVIGLTDPFSGGAPDFGQHAEVGFHLFWAVFHQISGIPWLTIFKYFPAIIFMVTVLSVYILAKREGFGWEAALFTCLIPTAVGILGPGFLVAVAMALPLIPLAMFLAFNFRTAWSYLALFALVGTLVVTHLVTAVALAIIFVPYVFINLKSNFRHSLWVTLAVVTPLLMPVPWLFNELLAQVQGFFVQSFPVATVDLPPIIKTYGYLPIALCLLGTFYLSLRGGKKSYGLIVGLLALLAVLVAFYTFHRGPHLLYYRGLVPMMLMVSIVAGAGLMMVRNLRLWANVPLLRQNMGSILCAILIGLTLVIGIPVRQNIPYYHMIDEEDYQAFAWIRDNVDKSYERAILDPWKGSAFTAITGKYVYTYIGGGPTVIDEKAYEFLRSGSKDTTFLEDNDISIVYNRWECHNPDLVEVRENVYLLKKGK